MATSDRVKRVRIGEFRDSASELINRAARGETILILNRSRPVAKLVPIASGRRRPNGLVGSAAGTATVVGDIARPFGPPEAWFADDL